MVVTVALAPQERPKTANRPTINVLLNKLMSHPWRQSAHVADPGGNANLMPDGNILKKQGIIPEIIFGHILCKILRGQDNKSSTATSG
jgi:hypothetical protein